MMPIYGVTDTNAKKNTGGWGEPNPLFNLINMPNLISSYLLIVFLPFGILENIPIKNSGGDKEFPPPRRLFLEGREQDAQS